MLKTCPQCQGTKKCRGIGMMFAECPVCEGLGKLEPEKIKPSFRAAAVPLRRDSLPEEYFQNEAKKHIAGLKDANCAYKNYPKNFEPSKDNQNTPAANNPVQSTPIPLTEAEAAIVRTQIKERDDTIGMPKVTLSPHVQAELKAIEDAKLAMDATLTAATEYVEPESVASQTSESVAKSSVIMQPVTKEKGATNGKKDTRQAKAG